MSTTKPTIPDPLIQIHELNRLYLESLQQRDEVELLESGFPAGAVEGLRAGTCELLDSVAQFPRTLFELELRGPAGAADALPADYPLGPRQILDLTIAFCAWNISRDSVYHARLFFGLSPRAVHSLRTTSLCELPRVAMAARVRCAFSDSDWLWRELLTEARPEVRRQLILVALQPSVDPGSFDHFADDLVLSRKG